MSRRPVLYALLAALFLVAAWFQVRHSYGSVASLVQWESWTRLPFSLEPYSPVVDEVQPEAEQAGLKVGGRIVAVGDAELSGYAALTGAMGRARAGDTLPVTTADGRTMSIVLAPAKDRAPGVSTWSVVIVLQLLIPVLCLSLGFWAAGLRPRDPIAWLLLALLLSFSLTSRDRDTLFPAVHLRDLELLYQTICGSTWPIWMLLFGVYFPDRIVWDRRWPWAKWLLLVPTALGVVVDAVLAVAGHHDLGVARRLHELTAPLATTEQIIGMLCISVFFMALGTRMGMTEAPDARRRLWLLNAGSTLGLTPIFLVVVNGMVRGRDPFSVVPTPLVVLTLLMLLIFPLTLAYVIVVHRALDVRVVIRQGMQYAFARRGVLVLRVILWAAILFAISATASRPNTRQVDILRILGIGVFAIVMIGKVGAWLIAVTDRRFFREAYDAEKILNDLGEKVRLIVRTGPLVETVALRVSESLHVPRVAFLLEEGGTAGGYRPAHLLGYAVPPVVRFSRQGPTVRKLAEGEPLRVFLDDPKSWLAGDAPGAVDDRAALAALETQLLLPLSANERLAGFMSLGPKRSEEPYSATDLRLLRSVTTQTALALENSRLASAIALEVAQRERLNREVEIAREVQERLFPQTFPGMPGLDYAGSCRPALGVGGDYFDFLPLGENRFGVAIADVSGKGIGAALLMASLQASLRGQTINGPGHLGRLIDNVNRLVFEASPDNRYATFFYGEYDLTSRNFTFVNAGHCPPFILRGAGGRRELIRLKAGGTVVGLFRDSVYREGTVTLQQGDLFVAYTDGISEAMNVEEEEWGEGRLVDAAGRCDGIAAAEVITTLMREADTFVAGADQHDDMTLVVLRAV